MPVDTESILLSVISRTGHYIKQYYVLLLDKYPLQREDR